MAYDFSGKRALVTGAGKGIGRATALHLASLGAEVFALSRTQADLDSLKQENSNINMMCLDLSDWAATREAVSKICPIHLLVNNAAVLNPASLLEATPESFDQAFSINVKSVMNTTQVVAGDLLNRNEKGSIVNVSSINGVKPIQGSAVYSSTKGALEMLTRITATELGAKGIRANCVRPTLVLTPMSEPHFEKGQQWFVDRSSQKRVGTVEGVVNAIAFLLSDNSNDTNGHMLAVDTGYISN